MIRHLPNYQLNYLPEAWRCLVQRTIPSLNFIVANSWTLSDGHAKQVLSDNHTGDSGRSEVLLGTGENQPILANIDWLREQIGRAVGHNGHARRSGPDLVDHRGRELDALDRLVLADVDVAGVGREVPLTCRRDAVELGQLGTRKQISE